ncbi:MAG: TonB-dependent receptor [Acidobacteriota bacterium]|nr:TonB-dependent receptor [Acidobacteriota bacterium]
MTTRRHRFVAAALAGPIGLIGLSGLAASDAFAQPVQAPARAARTANTPVKIAEQASTNLQHARVAGTIKDDQGAAVEGAMITALGTTQGWAVSDQAGKFSLALPPGEYHFRVHREGYSSTFREAMLLRAQASITRAIVIHRTGERGVMTAGLGGRPLMPGLSGEKDPKEHPHTEQAWRLRHLKRPALRDSNGLPEMFGDEDPGTWDAVRGAFGAPARFASSIFTGLPIDGEFRLVTASSLGSYASAFSELSAAGVAYFSVRAPVGLHGEWSVRGTMTSADLSTWLVAGDYVTKPKRAHAFNIGMSYGSQGMPAVERGPMPVTSMLADRSRNAGQLYAFDRWRLTPAVLVDYGTRVDYYDYLPDASVLWSPMVAVELTPRGEGGSTTVKLAATTRRDAPGSAEFAPPPAGPWLPPHRMFAALPGEDFRVERTDHAEITVEHRFDDAYAVALRRFSQRTANQVATVFGLERPGLSREAGHYYVASAGDASVDGWSLRLSTPQGQPVHASVDYAIAEFELTPVSGSLLGARGLSDRVHDITATLGADVPQTRTRMLVLYRVSTGYATLDEGSALGSRFDLQLNQGVPFLPSTAGRWEVLLSVRNVLRDQRFGMSMLDELLAVSTPKRIVGGVQVKF